MKIAIVGSQGRYWTPETRKTAVLKLVEILNMYNKPNVDIVVVSGVCPYEGMDIYAEVVATIFGYELELYPARTKDRIGYRERNYQIAKACDVLYCFDPRGRGWSGGKWTMKMAKELGKETHLVEIDYK